jgi:Ca2+-transporting ATPase
VFVANPESAAWHALSVEEVVARLGTDAARGLPGSEADRRLVAVGDNVVREQPPVPLWRRLLRQFQELVVWILLAAACISGFLRDWADAAAIVAIVLVNTIIGFLQEERALEALAALRRLSAPLARVVRDGVVAVIPARRLVPGDRIELEAGDNVPADARLVEAHGLRVQESSLTGESVPVAKEPAPPLAAETPLGDRRSLVHAGTVVAAGHGAAVVVATGMTTELGRIASLLEHADQETTPLQRQLAELGRLLIAACLVVVGVIFVLEVARGRPLAEVLLQAVSLAVAAVPEGLPAVVTLVLAIGLQRMVARNVLVRRLPGVETLGCVTVICSDKTGTLTRNEMTVREIGTAAGTTTVTGAGYAPHGEFLAAGSRAAVDPRTEPELRRLLTIAARCNNATVQPRGDAAGWQVIGDPTEGALAVAAMKAGIATDDDGEPVVFEVPFDSDRKRMSVVVRRRDGSRILYSKGAPEEMLHVCVAEQSGGAVVPLTAERRREILAAGAEMAGRALRVLALAWREVPATERPEWRDGPGGDDAAPERQLVHVGLVGMIDPPRDEAKEAVRKCLTAGIRPVMITGDHPATALAIGRELGLVDGAGRVVTGVELDAMPQDRLDSEVTDIAVYARVSAEHKLRVVQAWQRRGAVVAMTGDGVNDAPAVRAADIGIAMGLAGTDVTKEASDMVLADDNFASIVSAVEEGRGIYDNIQKFMHYLLACNAGEVMLMFVAAVAGWPAPLAAIQILWLNLITDGLPALALGVEPAERDTMCRPPRPPRQPVITRGRGLTILLHGALVAAVALAAFRGVWQGQDDRLLHAQTVTFCVAAFSQLFFAIGCRSDRLTALQLGFFGNPALLLAILLSMLLQVIVVMLPYAQPVFAVHTDVGRDWLPVVLLSLVPVTTIECIKWLRVLWGRWVKPDAAAQVPPDGGALAGGDPRLRTGFSFFHSEQK